MSELEPNKDVMRNETGPSGQPKSSTGLDENVAGLLCYLAGFITGIIFLVVEKDSRLVKFHAMQSICLNVVIIVATTILAFIPFIGLFLNSLIGLGAFVLWILMMVTTYQGKKIKLPIIGDFAENQVR